MIGKYGPLCGWHPFLNSKVLVQTTADDSLDLVTACLEELLIGSPDSIPWELISEKTFPATNVFLLQAETLVTGGAATHRLQASKLLLGCLCSASKTATLLPPPERYLHRTSRNIEME